MKVWYFYPLFALVLAVFATGCANSTPAAKPAEKTVVAEAKPAAEPKAKPRTGETLPDWSQSEAHFNPKPVKFDHRSYGATPYEVRQAGAVRIVIVGEVKYSGLYYFCEAATIEDAVGAAGLKRLSTPYITLIRGEGENETRTNLSIRRGDENYGGDIIIQEGDILGVSGRTF